MVSSVGALCGKESNGNDEDDDYIAGTFRWDGSHLELFNCDSEGQNMGAAGRGLESRGFDVTFSRAGQRMALTSADDVEYVFDKQTLPPSNVEDVRLIHLIQHECFSYAGASVQMIFREGVVAPSTWTSAVVSAPGWLRIDRFDDEKPVPGPAKRIGVELDEGGGAETPMQSDFDDRGARKIPHNNDWHGVNDDVQTVGYHITHAADLTPLFAVGFEIDNCDAYHPEGRGYEYDFRRNVTFRRYWDTQHSFHGDPIDLEVEGLSGKVKEIIVTVSVFSPDAADAKISVTSPDGTTLVLAEGRYGGSIAQYDYKFTSFSDRALRSVTDDSLSTFEDQLRPENPLSVFIGGRKNGTWTLSVDGSQPLELSYFGLSIR